MPASFAIFEKLLLKKIKSVLTQIVYIAMNAHMRKKYNSSSPKMDCIMLRKYTKTKHVNIRL